jgi:penicillin-binding protein 1A
MHKKTGEEKYLSLVTSLDNTISSLEKRDEGIGKGDIREFTELVMQTYTFRKTGLRLLDRLKELPSSLADLLKSKNSLKFAGMGFGAAALSGFALATILYATCAIKPLNWIGSKIPFIKGITYNYNLVKEGIKDLDNALSLKTTKVLSSDGVVLGEYFADKRDPVSSIADIPKPIIDAVCAMEDKKFYKHNFFDLKFGPYDLEGMARAAVKNSFRKSGNGRLVGGSTIEMQTVEAVRKAVEQYLGNKVKRTSNWEKKIAELVSCFDLYIHNSKDDIMRKYLNEIYFGQKSYGINVAVNTYLDMSLEKFKQLPLERQIAYAAMFAALPKSPVKYDPIINPQNNEVRAGLVLKSLKKEKPEFSDMIDFIYDFKANKWKISLEELVEDITINKLTTYPSDYAIDVVQQMDQSGFDKGYTINTTIDSKLQKIVSECLNKHIEYLCSSTKTEIEGAAIIIHAPTGNILALEGGSRYHYEPRGLNRAARAIQVGSLAKVPTFLLALNSGRYNQNSTVYDMKYDFNGYSPENYDRKYHGAVSLKYALAHSLNTIGAKLFAEMTDMYGFEEYRNFLESMGIKSDIKREIGEGLGRWNSSLLDMSGMFSTISNNGVFIKPHILKNFMTPEGKSTGYSSKPVEVIKPSVARQMKELLEYVVKEGTGKTVGRGGGKTGTTDECRAAWYIGFYKDYVIGAVVFNDENQAMYKRDDNPQQYPLFKKSDDNSLVFVGDTIMPFSYPLHRLYKDNLLTDTLKDSLGNNVLRMEGITPDNDLFYTMIKDSLSQKDTLIGYAGLKALGIYGTEGGGILVRNILDKMGL